MSNPRVRLGNIGNLFRPRGDPPARLPSFDKTYFAGLASKKDEERRTELLADLKRLLSCDYRTLTSSQRVCLRMAAFLKKGASGGEGSAVGTYKQYTPQQIIQASKEAAQAQKLSPQQTKLAATLFAALTFKENDWRSRSTAPNEGKAWSADQKRAIQTNWGLGLLNCVGEVKLESNGLQGAARGVLDQPGGLLDFMLFECPKYLEGLQRGELVSQAEAAACKAQDLGLNTYCYSAKSPHAVDFRKLAFADHRPGPGQPSVLSKSDAKQWASAKKELLKHLVDKGLTLPIEIEAAFAVNVWKQHLTKFEDIRTVAQRWNAGEAAYGSDVMAVAQIIEVLGLDNFTADKMASYQAALK